MDNLTLKGLVLVIVPLLCAFILCLHISSHTSREPVPIQPKIPLVGHVIGLWQYGGAYYTETRYLDQPLGMIELMMV